MLITRRHALITLGLTAFSGATVALPAPFMQPLAGGAIAGTNPQEKPSPNLFDDRLREDLARLEARTASEDGFPVFLACENLVKSGPSRHPVKIALSPLSANLSAALHRNAEAFQRIHPAAKAEDVTTILGVLAYRDFSTGQTKEGA